MAVTIVLLAAAAYLLVGIGIAIVLEHVWGPTDDMNVGVVVLFWLPLLVVGVPILGIAWAIGRLIRRFGGTKSWS